MEAHICISHSIIIRLRTYIYHRYIQMNIYMYSEMNYIKYGNGMSKEKSFLSIYIYSETLKHFLWTFRSRLLFSHHPRPIYNSGRSLCHSKSLNIRYTRDMITYKYIKDRITLRSHILFIWLTISLQLQDIL